MNGLIVNVGAVVVKNGKFIMVKEANDPFKNRWNFPLGRLEHETIYDGVIREVKEETGYIIKLTGFLGVFQNIPTSELNVIIILFTGEPVSGELQHDVNEHLQAKWFTLDEVKLMDDKELVHPAMRNTIKRAFEDRRQIDNVVNF